jgi:hypothetical protein
VCQTQQAGNLAHQKEKEKKKEGKKRDRREMKEEKGKVRWWE